MTSPLRSLHTSNASISSQVTKPLQESIGNVTESKATDNPFAAGGSHIIKTLSSYKEELKDLLQSPDRDNVAMFELMKKTITYINDNKSTLNNPDILKQTFEIIDRILLEEETLNIDRTTKECIFTQINSIYNGILEVTDDEVSFWSEEDCAIKNHCNVYEKYPDSGKSISPTHEITPEFFERNTKIIQEQETIQSFSQNFDILTGKLEKTHRDNNDACSIYRRDQQFTVIDAALKTLNLNSAYIDYMDETTKQTHKYRGDDVENILLNPTKLTKLFNVIYKILELEVSEETSNNVQRYHQIVDKLSEELNKPENAPLLFRFNNYMPITKEYRQLLPNHYLTHTTLKQEKQEKQEKQTIQKVMEFTEHATKETKPKQKFLVSEELITLKNQINRINTINELIKSYDINCLNFINSSRELLSKMIVLSNLSIHHYNNIVNAAFDKHYSPYFTCEALTRDANASDIANKISGISKLNCISEITVIKEEIHRELMLGTPIEPNITKLINQLLEQIDTLLKTSSNLENLIQLLHLISGLVQIYESNKISKELKQLICQPKINIINRQTQVLNDLINNPPTQISKQELKEKFVLLLNNLRLDISKLTHEMLDDNGKETIESLLNIVNNGHSHARICTIFGPDPLQETEASQNILTLLNDLKKPLNHLFLNTSNIPLTSKNNCIEVKYLDDNKTTTQEFPPILYVEDDKTFMITDNNTYNDGVKDYMYSVVRRSITLFYTNNANTTKLRSSKQRWQVLQCEIKNIVGIMKTYKSHKRGKKIASSKSSNGNFYEYILLLGHDNLFNRKQYRRMFLCLLLNRYASIKQEFGTANNNQQSPTNHIEWIEELLNDKKNKELLNKITFVTSDSWLSLEIRGLSNIISPIKTVKAADILISNPTKVEQVSNENQMTTTTTTTATPQQSGTRRTTVSHLRTKTDDPVELNQLTTTHPNQLQPTYSFGESEDPGL